MKSKLLTVMLMILSAIVVISCSDDTSGKNNGGGTSYTGDIDVDYPNMKVGIKTFIPRVSTITPAEKASVIEKLAAIRTLFNTKEFEEVVRGNWKEFNKYDEGSLQEKYTGMKGGVKQYTTDYWGGNPDGKADGGCSVPIHAEYWPDLKPCGSMLGYNKANDLRYFLSEVDQTDAKYKDLPFYNASFAKKKFKDLLDENRMMELFKKANYNVRIEKQTMTGSDRANKGPYRYLMNLDDPKITGDDTGLYIAFPNQDWTKAIGNGNPMGIIMHGMMHNFGFDHTQETNYFGRNINPVTAISQYVGWEGDKLLKGQAPYDKPEIQEMYKKIKEVYMQRYSGL